MSELTSFLLKETKLRLFLFLETLDAWAAVTITGIAALIFLIGQRFCMQEVMLMTAEQFLLVIFIFHDNNIH